MIHIIKTVPRRNDELITAFSSHSAATVHEAMGQRGALSMSIKPITDGLRICGRAITVQCHTADNIMLVKAISIAGKGDVIVADMGAAIQSGPFGEVLATECIVKGISGIVLSCAVRDADELRGMPLPIFSAGFSVRGTAKASLGTINHPISSEGTIIYPGDIILGDNDGVVAIPLTEAADILEASNARVLNENKVKQRLKNGESLFDIYGYQKVFDSLGCVEEK
jgi:4-hydroxy-4-methyl-2-oxoglutarate aldolase